VKEAKEESVRIQTFLFLILDEHCSKRGNRNVAGG
jgi:hypothetical protein